MYHPLLNIVTMSKPKDKNKNFKKKAPKKTQKNGKVKKATKAPAVAWSKVKIAGNLVTDDGGGLEGLIGLEVLENYEPSVVTSSGKVCIYFLLLSNLNT